MATYTLDWSETDLGGSAVVSYGSGAVLDFTDKPAAATSALSLTAHQSDGVDNILAEFTIETTGSSVMTFDYKVSTESGWDKFHIDVDGVSQANYSGLVAWTSHTGINIASAGVHTIRFRYTKDSGGSGNADRVWVALLNITNTVTTNDASGSVDTSDMEDGAIPAAVTTSTWTNSTSEPIAGTRSLRSPAAPANSGSYDLEVAKPATSDYAAVGFDWKTSTEAGWDKLFIFPDATASNVPASGSPSTPGESGWLDYSGSQSGRLAVILPAAASTILLRYTKDGGGSGGSDAVWIDNLDLPATGGGGEVAGTGVATAPAGAASGTGTALDTGTGAPTARAATGAGAGTVTDPGAGAASGPAATAAGTGSATVTGAGTAAAQAGTADGSGVATVTGSGTAIAEAGTAGGAGVTTTTGAGAATAEAGIAAGTSEELAATGPGAATAPAAEAAGAGTATTTGAGAAAATPGDADGTGTAATTGAGAATGAPGTASGSGVGPGTSTGTGDATAPAGEAAGAGTAEVTGAGAAVAGEGVAFGTEALPPILTVGRPRPHRFTAGVHAPRYTVGAARAHRYTAGSPR